MPLYIFFCFNVLEATCNKLNAIARSFWWEHEVGSRKLHLIKWDTICQPRNIEGLGLKNFKTINQALLAKQYWRLQQSPNSLLAKTYKAKYFPRTTLKDHKTKPHHSWIWRNMANPSLASLKEGHWVIRDGHQIPLTHLDWFKCSNHNLIRNNLLGGTVADLINQNKRTWNHTLIRKLYQPHISKEIMQLHIPRTLGLEDKLLWRHF